MGFVQIRFRRGYVPGMQSQPQCKPSLGGPVQIALLQRDSHRIRWGSPQVFIEGKQTSYIVHTNRGFSVMDHAIDYSGEAADCLKPNWEVQLSVLFLMAAGCCATLTQMVFHRLLTGHQAEPA